MAKEKETTQEKKKRRNENILKEYSRLKQTMTTREAQILLASMFDVSKDTITKVLFDKTYSNSPLQQSVAIAQTKSMPV